MLTKLEDGGEWYEATRRFGGLGWAREIAFLEFDTLTGALDQGEVAVSALQQTATPRGALSDAGRHDAGDVQRGGIPHPQTPKAAFVGLASQS